MGDLLVSLFGNRFLWESLSCLEQAKCLLNRRIVLIQIFRPRLLAVDVIDDTTDDKTLQKLMRLLNHQITTLQAVLIGKACKLIDNILILQITLHILDLLHLAQTLTVLISIIIGKLQNESTHRCLLIIRGHAQCILRNKDIRSNTTATIDHTTISCMILRSRVLDTVDREELTMLITAQPVIIIMLAIGIGFLDATA